MINRSDNITDFRFGMVRNQETRFLPTGPPLLESSTRGKLIEGRQWGSLNIRERSWGMKTMFKLEEQRDANSIWSNFSIVTFLSKLNAFSPFFHSLELCSYSLQNATEGLSQNVFNIWKAKDHRSLIVTWKPDFIFVFSSTNPDVREL